MPQTGKALLFIAGLKLKTAKAAPTALFFLIFLLIPHQLAGRCPVFHRWFEAQDGRG